MKYRIILSILFGFSLALTAQEIDPRLYEKTWLDKETREFNGYQVMKVFGQYPHSPSAYNVLPITAISYKGFIELKEELIAKGKAENRSKSDLGEKLIELEQTSKGGELQIYISRYQEENANFRWFFVIIRSEEDKDKLWEKEIGYQAPQNPYERGWWNYTTLRIPIEVEFPFYIYFNDKQSKYLSDFKFRIDVAPGEAATN